jgi:predicted XRE-type DNA-binding protein
MVDKYDNVWDAISDTPEEAENMKLRSILMMAIEDFTKKLDGTQADNAALLGITQPRLNDLLKGKIHKFSLDMLVNIATKAGLSVEMNVRAA